MNNDQLTKLADISGDLGKGLYLSIFVQPVLSNQFELVRIIVAVLLSYVFVFLALYILSLKV